MRRLAVGALLALACACPSPQQIATSDGLFGYWRPRDGEQLVFAFAPANEAEELFNLSGNMIPPQTKPVGAVYQLDSLVQLTTYEATQRELTQTVLADVANPPGTKFSTRIDGFERGVSMQLESKKNAGASRTWDFYDFCPRSRDYGWGEVQVTACPSSLTTGGSAAFDKQGRLYVYTGSGLAPGTRCPPGPGFLEVQRGCGTVQYDAPNGRVSSSRVHDDDVLRIAYVHLDNSLRVRERKIGDKDFAETTLLPTTRTTSLTLLEQRGPLLLTGLLTASGDPQVFRRSEAGWVEGALKRRSTGQPMTLGPAVVDGSARLWVAAGTELWVERESDFELLPTRAPGSIGSLYLDPEGAPHVLVTTARGLEYAVLRGGDWERHVIDASTSGVIVTHGLRPYRVLTTAPAFRNPSGEITTWLHPALITIHEGGRLESELTGGPYNLLAGNTTFAAVGPRGEVAASLTGEVVMTRSPKGRLYPATKKLELQISGPPLEVSSADGRIRCEQSCTVDATLGERIAFSVAKKPGVLATLPSCDRPSRPASAPCWFSVVPPMNASTAEMNAVFKVQTRATPLKDAFAASNNQGLATTLGVSGDWVAVGTLFTGTATTYVLDDVELPVTGSFESQGLAMVNRASKQSLFVAVPRGVSIERVLPDGRGGLSAILLSSNLAVQVGGATVGASQTNVLSFLHLTAAGTADRVVTLHSSPRNSPFAVAGASVAVDGSAAVVVGANAPLTALGVTETNALVRVAADGTRTAHGFTGALPSGGQVFAVDEGRVVFAVNTTAGSTLSLWRGGALQSLALPGATVRALHANGSAIVVALSSAADVMVAGRQLSGLRHVLGLDASLAVTGAFSLPTDTPATWSWGIGLVPEGVGFLSGGELQWLSPALTPLRSVLPLPSTTMRVSGVAGPSVSVSGGSMFVLARPDMDFGGVAGSIAVAQLGVF